MIRTRSLSAETPRHQGPAASRAAPVSLADVNQLGIRILGLKSIPLEKGARLTALLECEREMKRMPPQFLPLLAGELKDACATLPDLRKSRALEALS
jgi:hypothetical protein